MEQMLQACVLKATSSKNGHVLRGYAEIFHNAAAMMEAGIEATDQARVDDNHYAAAQGELKDAMEALAEGDVGVAKMSDYDLDTVAHAEVIAAM